MRGDALPRKPGSLLRPFPKGAAMAAYATRLGKNPDRDGKLANPSLSSRPTGPRCARPEDKLRPGPTLPPLGIFKQWQCRPNHYPLVLRKPGPRPSGLTSK